MFEDTPKLDVFKLRLFFADWVLKNAISFVLRYDFTHNLIILQV